MRFRIRNNKKGSTMMMFVIILVISLIIAIIVIDVSITVITKNKLQNAADAAALAGAQYLPDSINSISAAESIAALNKIEPSEITVTTPYEADPAQVEVTCKRKVYFTFAQLLGLTDTEISVRSVAGIDHHWAGEVLPFINLDDDYLVDPEIEAWEKVSPGDIESINNYEMVNPGDPLRVFFRVDYMNGVELKKGTVATIKQEVGYIYDRHLPDKPVYVLSLSSEVMNNPAQEVMLKDGSYQELSKLKNGDIVDPSQIVILECIFHDYDYTGKTLFLTFLKEYKIGADGLPVDYISPYGGSSKLIE